jgi:hypothetical protein
MKAIIFLIFLLATTVQAKKFDYTIETADHQIFRSVALDSIVQDTLFVDMNGFSTKIAVNKLSRLIIERRSYALEGLLSGVVLGLVIGNQEQQSCKGEKGFLKFCGLSKYLFSFIFGLWGGIFGGIAGIDRDIDMQEMSLPDKKETLFRLLEYP